jgi:hypothetical protein
LARALARTLQEVRLAAVESRALEPIRPELSRLLRVYETELARARADQGSFLRSEITRTTEVDHSCFHP